MNLFKRNTTKEYSQQEHVNNVYGGGKKLRTPKIRKENETIKDRIIRDINKVLEHYNSSIKKTHNKNFPKAELPLCHIFHGFYPVILKKNKTKFKNS